MEHASSTAEIEDTKSVIYELALEILHPGHKTYRLWLSAIHALVEGYCHPTPLFVSAEWGFQNLTATLLVLGVRSATRSSSGGTALHLASEHGHVHHDIGAVQEAVHNPAVEQVNAVELAVVNVEDEDYSTPLHSACDRGHMNIVELLLAKGADVNAAGEYSGTPLRMACFRGHMNIVELFLEKGADVNASGGYSDTPLQAACLRGHMNIAKLLLSKGAD
ncbi:hypothetical protein PAXINDRAFT_83314, partial [Paxillus involutus ATCC 200175]